jgi:hypothetical protein
MSANLHGFVLLDIHFQEFQHLRLNIGLGLWPTSFVAASSDLWIEIRYIKLLSKNILLGSLIELLPDVNWCQVSLVSLAWLYINHQIQA